VGRAAREQLRLRNDPVEEVGEGSQSPDSPVGVMDSILPELQFGFQGMADDAGEGLAEKEE
jgi:hypothetical protein